MRSNQKINEEFSQEKVKSILLKKDFNMSNSFKNKEINGKKIIWDHFKKYTHHGFMTNKKNMKNLLHFP